MNDAFNQETPEAKKTKELRSTLLRTGLTFDPKKYEYKEDWVPARNELEVHSTGELIEALNKNPKAMLEARIIGTSNGRAKMFKVSRDQFLEWAKKGDSKKLRESAKSFREFDSDFGFNGGSAETIGKRDFTPLLGGPFNKQLYYRDYLRMISASFYAYHHDPAAKAVTNILTDFTMGRGFQLHADNPAAQAIWNAFVEVNNFHEQMDYAANELSAQGEIMWWWLPNKQIRISFNPVAGEKVPTGLLPRLRLIDPSNIAEIITIPEDMQQGVLYYVWMAPTQYQMYTRDGQPSSKFIYNQIPASQIMHFKVNSFSNEKRGRSDFFSALGYMKRLRDGTNFALVAQQKAAAWCLDTTIDGDAADINAYILDQQTLENNNGTQTAGSEFVHTSAIKREYLANSATSKGGDSPVFSWCLNMVAMASGIPVAYLGTHLSGGSTRASAVTSTEPVNKRFERRQMHYERMVRKIFNRVCQTFGIESNCEIIFPELLSQDRSALFKDLSLAQANDWLKPSRAAEIANKELDSKDFNYDKEIQDIIKQKNELGLTLPTGSPGAAPLTAPAIAAPNKSQPKSGGVSGADKSKIKADLSQ